MADGQGWAEMIGDILFALAVFVIAIICYCAIPPICFGILHIGAWRKKRAQLRREKARGKIELKSAIDVYRLIYCRRGVPLTVPELMAFLDFMNRQHGAQMYPEDGFADDSRGPLKKPTFVEHEPTTGDAPNLLSIISTGKSPVRWDPITSHGNCTCPICMPAKLYMSPSIV